MQRLLPLTVALLAALQVSAEPVNEAVEIPLRAPAPSVAVADDATALWINPAGLVLSSGIEGIFLHTQDVRHDQSSGDGLVLKASGFAFGLEYLRPKLGNSRKQLLRYSIGLAPLNYRDLFSAGIALQIYNPTEGGEEASVDWSAGAILRPWRYVSLGVAGRNLSRARIYKDAQYCQDRTLELGLAVRPGIDWLTLSVDTSMFSDRSMPLGFRAEVRPVDGLALVGTYEMIDEVDDFVAGVGLSLDLANFGVGSYNWFDQDDYSANTSYARVSYDRYPALFTMGGDWIRLDIDGQVKAGALITELPLLGGDGVSVLQLTLALERAARDPAVDGLLLVVRPNELGFADIQDLRAAIKTFRDAGKHAVAYLESGGELNYLLAVSTERVIMPPASVLPILGPKITAMYFRETLAAVGIKVEAEWAENNPYKSSPEQFVNDGPSDAAREAFGALVADLSEQYLAAVAEGRRLTRKQVVAAREQGLLGAEEARKAGLIDSVAYLDRVRQVIRESLGTAPPGFDGGYLGRRSRRMAWGPRPRIGVVDLRGTIVTGKGGRGLLGGRRIGGSAVAAAVEAAGKDPSLEALVLRIDSPGGSGFASDQIWRQLRRAAKNKPLVASMGKVAASGGYYLSSAADTILAQPATLTGSIGAYALRFDASGLLDLLRVRTATFKEGAHADYGSLWRPATPEERTRLRGLVTRFYEEFLAKVAETRKTDKEKIRQAAGGRVWTGRQALEQGLVDELGGMSRAVALARERAGIDPDDEIELIVMPEEPFSLRMLLQRVSGSSESVGTEVAGQALALLSGLEPEQLDLLLSIEQERPLMLMPMWVEFE